MNIPVWLLLLAQDLFSKFFDRVCVCVSVSYECAVRNCVCARSSKIPVWLLLLLQDPFFKFFERVWVWVGGCYDCVVRECVPAR